MTSDIEVRKDLIETLNLNCSTAPLIAERKAALDGLIEEIGELEEENIQTYCSEQKSDWTRPIQSDYFYWGCLWAKWRRKIESTAGTFLPDFYNSKANP